MQKAGAMDSFGSDFVPLLDQIMLAGNCLLPWKKKHTRLVSELDFFALCLVCLHVATLDESLATDLTNIWPFSGVGHSVLLQMLQHSKGCATHITVVWLFTSVHSLMNATLRM